MIADLYEYGSAPVANPSLSGLGALLIGTVAVALIYVGFRQTSTRRKVVLTTSGLVLAAVAILVATGR